MKAHRMLLICLLPLVSYASDYAEEESGIRYSASEPQACFNFDDRHIARCVGHFRDQSEAVLAQKLAHIRGRLERDLELFNEAQSRWDAFKESECKVRSVSAQAYQDPQRQQQLLVDACAAELNQTRVVQLEQVQLGCDSCLQ